MLQTACVGKWGRALTNLHGYDSSREVRQVPNVGMGWWPEVSIAEGKAIPELLYTHPIQHSPNACRLGAEGGWRGFVAGEGWFSGCRLCRCDEWGRTEEKYGEGGAVRAPVYIYLLMRQPWGGEGRIVS